MKKAKPKLFNREYQTKWSETHNYKHIHTGEYCTFESYVAEFIVLRRAEKLNTGKPSYKFWTKGDPNYWFWKKQHGAAIQLKKKYSEEAILAAIKSKDFENLLALGVQNGRSYKINPAAEKVIAKYQKLIDEKIEKDKMKNQETPTTEKKEELETRSAAWYNSKSASMNKLRNL
jgi:hypothetical protein